MRPLGPVGAAVASVDDEVVIAGREVGTWKDVQVAVGLAPDRALEVEAEVILKGTNVDGIYTADPRKDPSATFLPELTYQEAIVNGYEEGIALDDIGVAVRPVGVADAMRLKYPGVDAAYTNSGGLRADLNCSPPSAGEASAFFSGP